MVEGDKGEGVFHGIEPFRRHEDKVGGDRVGRLAEGHLKVDSVDERTVRHGGVAHRASASKGYGEFGQLLSEAYQLIDEFAASLGGRFSNAWALRLFVNGTKRHGFVNGAFHIAHRVVRRLHPNVSLQRLEMLTMGSSHGMNDGSSSKRACATGSGVYNLKHGVCVCD